MLCVLFLIGDLYILREKLKRS